MVRHAFRAMGTEVTLLLDAEPSPAAAEAVAAAEDEFHRLESLLTRFRPESELSRLNARGRLRAGADLRRVVELALEARDASGGRFDPTVHDALVAAGYDRTFDELERNAPAERLQAAAGGTVALRDGEIVLGDGVRLDLGGIGKGYAADRACSLLGAAGPALVDAGGDVAASPRAGGWPVGVETPNGTLTLELSSGGLATSGRDRRAWRRGGAERHHLIDPRTATPAATDVLRVTVAAGSAVEAETRAKALFLAGSATAAAAEADAAGTPCVVVADDGRTFLAGGLA